MMTLKITKVIPTKGEFVDVSLSDSAAVRRVAQTLEDRENLIELPFVEVDPAGNFYEVQFSQPAGKRAFVIVGNLLLDEETWYHSRNLNLEEVMETVMANDKAVRSTTQELAECLHLGK